MNNKKGGSSSKGQKKFLLNSLYSLDFFQQPLPMFNIQGKSSVPSICGSIISLLIYSVLMLYATTKGIQMANKHNPAISTFNDVGITLLIIKKRLS